MAGIDLYKEIVFGSADSTTAQRISDLEKQGKLRIPDNDAEQTHNRLAGIGREPDQRACGTEERHSLHGHIHLVGEPMDTGGAGVVA